MARSRFFFLLLSCTALINISSLHAMEGSKRLQCVDGDFVVTCPDLSDVRILSDNVEKFDPSMEITKAQLAALTLPEFELNKYLSTDWMKLQWKSPLNDKPLTKQEIIKLFNVTDYLGVGVKKQQVILRQLALRAESMRDLKFVDDKKIMEEPCIKKKGNCLIIDNKNLKNLKGIDQLDRDEGILCFHAEGNQLSKIKIPALLKKFPLLSTFHLENNKIDSFDSIILPKGWVGENSIHLEGNPITLKRGYNFKKWMKNNERVRYL